MSSGPAARNAWWRAAIAVLVALGLGGCGASVTHSSLSGASSSGSACRIWASQVEPLMARASSPYALTQVQDGAAYNRLSKVLAKGPAVMGNLLGDLSADDFGGSLTRSRADIAVINAYCGLVVRVHLSSPD